MSRQKKERLDIILCNRGLVETRQKGQAMILAGLVRVNGNILDKAGTRISEEAKIELTGKTQKYVGRGGDKLEAALAHFSIKPQGQIALDVGASTGGFTDCLLQQDANLVYAVDVGHHQLDFRLRENPKVRVMEKTNARALDIALFDPLPTLGVIDVSFIGLRKILEPVLQVMAPSFTILALVKPQFELERNSVGAGGVVREVKDQLRAVSLVEEFAIMLGLQSLGSFPSPLRGEKKGNQEYFLCLTT